MQFQKFECKFKEISLLGFTGITYRIVFMYSYRYTVCYVLRDLLTW